MRTTTENWKPAELGSETLQWTIKGIDKETRELSRMAAKKCGMKLSAWVETALRSAAKTELDDPEFRLKIRDNDVSQLLREQNRKLDSLESDVRLLQRGVIESLLNAKQEGRP